MNSNPDTFDRCFGVDVSRSKLDVADAEGNLSFCLRNSPTEIADKLISRIEDPERTLVIVEATGGYERLLTSMLQKNSWPASNS